MKEQAFNILITLAALFSATIKAQIFIAPSSTMVCGGVSTVQFTVNPHSFPWMYYVTGQGTNCAKHYNASSPTNTLCTVTFSCPGSYVITLKGAIAEYTWTAGHTVYCTDYVGVDEIELNTNEPPPVYYDLMGTVIEMRYNEPIIERRGYHIKLVRYER